MATNTPHSKSRVALRGLAITLAMLCLSPCSPTSAATASTTAGGKPTSSYGWPLKPFNRQHPVRGFFGDPRVHGETHGFHFGVDISAPDGTPVYATLTGRVYVERERPETVAIRSAGDPSVVFSYWHLVPTLRTGQQAVAQRTMIGRISRGWGHVHFAESVNEQYRNPLRPGAMGPFADSAAPVVRAVGVERHQQPIGLHSVTGKVDLVVDAFDRTPLAVPTPWRNMPVMPALVRWRILNETGRPVTRWATAVDFRLTIPPPAAYTSVFAARTRQNHPNRPGRYRVYLARNWNASRLAAGGYRIQASVTDAAGNAAGVTTRIAVASPLGGTPARP
jgi:hypothetical protein